MNSLLLRRDPSVCPIRPSAQPGEGVVNAVDLTEALGLVLVVAHGDGAGPILLLL